MAISSTINKVSLNIADMDRHLLPNSCFNSGATPFGKRLSFYGAANSVYGELLVSSFALLKG